ncbi:hypothetical protein [uncultured Corynebacterium sp.]|uniref:hypothetical protein n=1 Tax=uncultured Corynebacterium sp. TaxID=159447 RepID=UPI002595F2C9|nr:hypothetical protein [uncultured Corynebacterium sp.]
MSELEEKVVQLIEQQAPATFEQWVESRSEGDQDAIGQALDYAYRTASYAPVYRVLRGLNDNPWRGSKDAMINYAKRRFGA